MFVGLTTTQLSASLTAVANAFYIEFGRRLRKARTDAGLSQDLVAKRVGLSRTSITNIELGRQHVALHMLYQFASTLGVQPMTLLPTEFPHTSPDVVEPRLLRKAGVPEGGREEEWVSLIVKSSRTEKKT